MGRKPKKRAAGQGTVFQRGGNWWVRWRERGQRRNAKFPSEELARRALAKIVADLAAGRVGLEPDLDGAPTLAELAEPWLGRRERAGVIRSWRDDKNRWNKHLKPFFGECRPHEVDVALVRRFVEKKIGEGLAPASVRHALAALSGLFSDAIETGDARANPLRALPRSLRRMLKSRHDPKQTPHLARQEDVQRVYKALEQPFAALFAVGALAGLRPGEALALEWGDVDLDKARILVQRQVRHGRVGLPKSGKPRVVPVIPALAKILAEHRLATGAEGRLFPPLNPKKGGTKKTPARYLSMEVVHEKLRDALKACGLPETMTLYQCGRHTYGALHVIGGGSLAVLREILGHSSVQVTERYGHLAPGHFREDALMTFTPDMGRDGAVVVDLAARRAERDAAAEDDAGDQPLASVP